MEKLLEIRIKWMRLYGINEEEIAFHNENNPPTSLEEEMAELEAVYRLQDSNLLEKLKWNKDANKKIG